MHVSGPTNHATSISRGSFNNNTTMQSDLKERFYRHFQQEALSLQEQMSHVGNLAAVGGERIDAINYCLASISRLESEVSDASDYIPAYDQRAYSQAIKALSEKLQETRKQVVPKAKFAFKAIKKNNSALSLADAAELEQERLRGTPSSLFLSNESSRATTTMDLNSLPSEPSGNFPKQGDMISPLPSFLSSNKDYNVELSHRPSSSGKPIRKPSFTQAKNIVISDHSGLHIILPASASHATSSGSITNMERCVVDLSIPTSTKPSSNGESTLESLGSSPFAGLTLRNLKNCVVIAGRVDGAAHITNVRNSIIVVSARQVRIHNSENTDVYLWCGSRPIIEGCSRMRFAELPGHYMKIFQPPKQATLLPNQWDQVDDFKWLKNEPSPNWSILPPEQKLPDSTWTEVVPGGPTFGLDDILRKVDVLKG